MRENVTVMFGMPETTARSIRAVIEERHAQDRKWGEQNHPPLTWIAVIAEELGEASQEALRTAEYSRPVDPQLLRQELVQIAASAVAAIESLDRSHATYLDLGDEPDITFEDLDGGS